MPDLPDLRQASITSAFTAVPGQYCQHQQQWQSSDITDTQAPKLQCARTDITVATFNVWFADHYFRERCCAMLALLQRHRPDIIALQEVTLEFLEQILANSWIQSEYQLSDIRGDSVDPYGVLILSRLPIAKWHFFALPTQMGRHLVTASALVNNATITFASVHLESLSETATRATQLAQIFPLLAPDPHVILMGDFNFCSSSAENHQLDGSYQDLWPLLHPTNPGFTEDTTINLMRRLYTRKHKQVRFDRMLLCSPSPGWQPEAIALLGTSPITPDLPNVFPSDHFGLLSKFTWHPHTRSR